MANMMQWLRDLKRPLDKVKIDSLYTCCQ